MRKQVSMIIIINYIRILKWFRILFLYYFIQFSKILNFDGLIIFISKKYILKMRQESSQA